MKKKYVKPQAAVEIFSVIQTTARECSDIVPEEEINSNDPMTCVWDWGGTGITYFVEGTNCDFDGETSGIVCYNNPGEGQYIFRS